MAKENKYGEKTKMVNYRVPESKVAEINQMVKLKLNEYEKDVLMLSERRFSETPLEVIPKWKQSLEKKSNPADDTIVKAGVQQSEYDNLQTAKKIASKITVENFGEKESDIVGVGKLTTIVKPKFTPNATKNAVNMDALRAMANGENLKSELFASKKKPIDEEYDCVMVTRGIPDILDRVYASAKSDVAFWDRNDTTVFYVVWESKCYRFVNSGHFYKFLKDNNIK